MTWTVALLSLLAVVLVLLPPAQTHPLTQAPVAEVHISSVDLVINSPSLADRSFASHDDSPTIQLEIIPPRKYLPLCQIQVQLIECYFIQNRRTRTRRI